MKHEPGDETDSAPHLSGDDEEDRVVAALDFLRGVLSGGGEAHWQADSFRQKSHLQGWAEDLGLLLNPEEILPPAQERRSGARLLSRRNARPLH